jgi:hypothetical protein
MKTGLPVSSTGGPAIPRQNLRRFSWIERAASLALEKAMSPLDVHSSDFLAALNDDQRRAIREAHSFIGAYFGSIKDKEAWMLSFSGDPGTHTDWKGDLAYNVVGDLPREILRSKKRLPNLYWSPYRYREGKRSSDSFIEAVAIVVDDVGAEAAVRAADQRHEQALERYRLVELAAWQTKPVEKRGAKPKPPKRQGVKVSSHMLIDRIGYPTSALTTSPANEQWFYRLNPPCRDKAKLKQVLMAIGSDAKDLARVVRCPGGANWKETLRDKGAFPFPGELTDHVPERSYTIDEIFESLGLVAEAEQQAPPRRSAATGEEKLEFQALREAGLLLGSAATGNPDTHGSYWMICPGHLGGEAEGGWLDAEIGHSEGKDEGSARVWPHGGYKCFHDSCRERSFNDLCLWTARHPDAGPILDRLKREEGKAAFGDDDGEEDIVGTVRPHIRVLPGETPQQIALAVKALKATGRVFSYGRQTVQVNDLVERNGIGGKVEVAQIASMVVTGEMQALLENTATWSRFNSKGQEVYRGAPPLVATNICVAR